jgi:hypothetical protein
MRTITALLLTVVAGIGFAASAASAAPITFIHTVVDGSGSIGDIEFVRKDITITAFGDTSSRFDFGSGYHLTHTSASITIDDVGTFDFLVGTQSFVNNNIARAGFSRDTTLLLAETGQDPSLAAWNMLTSIGPVPGARRLLQWDADDVLTTGGVLVLNTNSGLGGTFEAIVIPAPASIAAFASVGLLAGRRRR